jgi:hypothetical protein
MDLDIEHRSRIAQWAFDTRSVLGRFHLWLEDVDVRWVQGGPSQDGSFAGLGLERAFVMSTAVTALGTRLFGRFGEGDGLDSAGLNRVKKDADAASAYAMSEALWHVARTLPENHAILVSLGEGIMPKAGETPEMGSNPLLGFGRVYARPQVARFLERRVRRLLNEHDYRWEAFWEEIQEMGITVWGAAIDTLENTSRFAKGSPTGPMAILHLFDQPLAVARPYEGYMGTLVLPRAVTRAAEERSILCTYLTPRAKVLEAITGAYPDVSPDRVHVWSLGGASREGRIGSLWECWRALGVHVVEDGFRLPGGGPSFTESGTYAPVFQVGDHMDGDGKRHVFICDGYAASAEAIQAASLDPMLGVHSSMVLFSSYFETSWDRESGVMALDPGAPEFATALGERLGTRLDDDHAERYRENLSLAREANMPVQRRTVVIDDFFPTKTWRALAYSATMCDDPYSALRGVEQVSDDTYRVMAREASEHGVREVTLTLRLMETFDESRKVFSPLLDRFYAGEDYTERPVKISDSGRIRNELQTWCSEALEFGRDDTMRVHLDRVDDAVLSPEKRAFVRNVLAWYQKNHPIWFRWLDLK